VGGSSVFSVMSLALLSQISLRYTVCPETLAFSLILKLFETHSSALAHLLIIVFMNQARIEPYLHLTASVETLVIQ